MKNLGQMMKQAQEMQSRMADAVLPFGVLNRLPRHWVFQFEGRDRNPVQNDDNI